MQRLNRRTIQLCLVLFFGGFVLVYAGNWLSSTLIWGVGGCAVILGMLTSFFVFRCPNCRSFTLRINPFAHNAGKCRMCGHKMEFDR